MERILIIILCLLSANVFGQVPTYNVIPQHLQSELGNMGISDSSLLNSPESLFFNYIFEKSRGHFDFTEKRIAFIAGSRGVDISDKAEYFKKKKGSLDSTQPHPKETLYVFNQWYQIELDYDAAIVYGCAENLSMGKVVEILEEGRAESDSITQQESELINEIASEIGIDCDFNGKKVAFFTGATGLTLTSKTNYIYSCKQTNWFYPVVIAPWTTIYIFDEEEKANANGYDAAFVFGSVKQVPTKDRLIKRLHKKK